MRGKRLYKYLKSIAKDTLLLDVQEYTQNKRDEYVYINVLNEKKTFYRGFIDLFLLDDKYYNYINEVIDNGYDSIKIAYIDDRDIHGTLTVSIMDVMREINNKRRLSDLEKQRFTSLRRKISIDRYVSEIKDDLYTINVEGEDITLKSADILKIFMLNEKEFIETINKNKVLGIYNKKFSYILEKFLDDKKILERFIISSLLIVRYHNIKRHKYIDYQTINYYDNKKMNSYDAIISEKLKKAIYKGMNLEYSDLKKAIYIYIKLCKYFTYDPVFYASNQRGAIAEEHKDIKRLSKIESKDDLIVCYEFNAIYSEFLKDLGIENNVNVKSGNDEYGESHANLDFRIGGYIVKADAVTSIINSDLVNAKIDEPLRGLKCLNISEKSQKEFSNILEEVYQDVINETYEKNESYPIGQVLTLYRAFCDEVSGDLNSKLDLFFDEINNSQLKTMDALGYMSKLKKIMFTPKELQENISFVIVRSTLNGVNQPALIVTVNEYENMNESDNNKYYYYIPGNEQYTLIAKNELENKFINSDFKYIEYTKPRIPGIDLNPMKGKKI